MEATLITAVTGTGGFAAAVATAGLCWSVGAGNPPEPALMGVLVAGVMVLVIGFVMSFEQHSRLWASQIEAQRQARRHGLQLTRAVAASAPQARTSND